MHLFYEEMPGHLRPEALSALLQGHLEEEERFLVAEHLSFCDHCVSLYTNMLPEESLLQAPDTLAGAVALRLPQARRTIPFTHYLRAVASVALAFGLWQAGFFLPQRVPAMTMARTAPIGETQKAAAAKPTALSCEKATRIATAAQNWSSNAEERAQNWSRGLFTLISRSERSLKK